MDNQFELAVLRPTGDTSAQRPGISSSEGKEGDDRNEVRHVTELSQRLDTLEGKTIGLFWNTKPNGDIFLDRVGELLVEQFRDVKLIKYFPGKPTVINPCPLPAIREVAENCDGVINGFGD